MGPYTTNFFPGSFVMLREYDAFISYTRQQGTSLADRVLDLLKGHSFKVWQDSTHMRGGEDFWHQIETAIERANYLIMILTPDAFEGDRLVLRNEWLAARRRGCAVLPVFERGSCVDFSSSTVPAWLKKLDCYDLDDANHRTKLVNDLRTTPVYRPIPHNVGFPDYFVRRDDEMTAILFALTNQSGNTREAIITALRGGGGFGKTTLAKALCFEDFILTRYTDGVLWLTVGEGERSPANLLTTLLQELSQTPKSADVDALFGQWQEALRSRTCLVVLDDVWRESDALALIVRETASAFLITTRIPRVVTAVDALDCLVVEMRDDHALNLLGSPLGKEANKFEDRLNSLIKKAGHWPILLGLIAGQLRHIMRRPGATPERALALIDEDLTDLGLTAYDRQNSIERAGAVARTIAASLKFLTESSPGNRADERYLELAVFPDDEFLEIAVLQDLWKMSRPEARRLAETFDDSGLATFDLSLGLRLHDVFLEYFRNQLDATSLRALHQQLMKSWPDQYRLPHTYAWRWYGWHCLHSGMPERLAIALLDFQWLSVRLSHADLPSLLTDCRRAMDSISNKERSFAGLHDALELSFHVLQLDPKQLAAQLYGRLRQGQTLELDELIAQTEQVLAAQTLFPLTQNLCPAGSPLKRTLLGHTSWVEGAFALADGRLLSWGDRTTRLWASNGQALTVLSGHEGSVAGVKQLSDGRILSWSYDHTLRLWSSDGKALSVLNGHGSPVTIALTLSNSRLLSCSGDATLMLWSMEGQSLAVLRGHEDFVNGALELSGGQLVSWSKDRTIRLWAADDGQPLSVLRGHEGSVVGVKQLFDGRLLSWSEDKTLRLWSVEGQSFAVLRGHEDFVSGALELSGGRLVSWSKDQTIRLWAADDGQPLSVLRGHEGSVVGVKQLFDGRLLSWSEDKTLRLWSVVGQPLTVLRGHEDRVNGVQELSDCRLLSYGDKTLRLWTADGQALTVLRGHGSFVKGVLTLPDGRLLSWSWDKTLRIWAVEDSLLNAIAGHENDINGLLNLSNGHMLSWSEDKTLRQWGADGQSLAVLRGHEGAVFFATQLSDGRLLSCSSDNTSRLWGEEGQPLRVLRGHEDRVNGAKELSDGRLLSWSWDKTLLLWTADGQLLTALLGHEGAVFGAKELPNGRLLSWSEDNTLRMWTSDGISLKVMNGHKDWVGGVEELSDHRLLSWSWVSNFDLWLCDGDYIIWLWAPDGQRLTAMLGHEGPVFGVCELSDSRLLSWSYDKTLRLWSAEGQALTVLCGHENSVKGVHELSDGRLLSWSWDMTLRLWSKDGTPLQVLAGHEDKVNGVLVMADGRFLSWSDDKAVRLWSGLGDLLDVLYFDAAINVVAKVDEASRFMVCDSSGGIHWINVT